MRLPLTKREARTYELLTLSGPGPPGLRLSWGHQDTTTLAPVWFEPLEPTVVSLYRTGASAPSPRTLYYFCIYATTTLAPYPFGLSL